MGLVFWFVGKPMLQFVSQPDQFRDWVDTHGIWGRLAFLGMVMLQVFVAIILESPWRLGLAMLSAFWRHAAVRFGHHPEQHCHLPFCKKVWHAVRHAVYRGGENPLAQVSAERPPLNLIAFILFFIPGTPKDVLTYIVGLTPMRLRTWVLITTVARIPSVITSTIGGDALGTQNYLFAVIVFVATAAISGLGVLAYRKITQHHQRKERERRPWSREWSRQAKISCIIW